jgi:FAD synthase
MRRRLRPELTFSDPEELKTQIRKDIDRCRGLLTVFPRIP